MKSFQIKRLLLALLTIISLYYCLEFGYLLTGYARGGQILGIPFAVCILLLTIKYFSSRSLKHFVLTLACFTSFTFLHLVILFIKLLHGNWFEFLYVYGNADIILICWLIGTIIIGVVINWYFNRIKKRRTLNENHGA